MELAIGIQLHCKSALTATLEGETLTEIPISKLGSIGLPTLRRSSAVCTFDLNELQECAFEEYSGFFLQAPIASTSHTMWSITHSDTRFIIPALALIRAIAQPTRSLIAQIFKPQSLEDICEYRGAEDEFLARPSKNIGSATDTTKKSIMARLSWMYCFPSARRMWASVYQSAKTGAIHINRTSASITFELKGVKSGSIFYVTTLNILNIKPYEQPFDFAAGHPMLISASGGRSRVGEKNYKKLTETEWGRVAKVLESHQWKRRPGTYDRAMVDCLLQTISTNKSASGVARANDLNPAQAAASLRRWRSDGRLTRVVECLLETRGSSLARIHERKTANTTIEIGSVIPKISDTEWNELTPILGRIFYREALSVDLRSVVNCLWHRHISNDRLSLPKFAKIYNIPQNQLRNIHRRWSLDGRYDKLISFLQLPTENPHTSKSTSITNDQGKVVRHEVSDSSFFEIEAMLSANPTRPFSGTEKRVIVDCVIRKILSGETWIAAAAVVGADSEKVRRALVRWRSDGRLDRILSKVRQMRGLDECHLQL